MRLAQCAPKLFESSSGLALYCTGYDDVLYDCWPKPQRFHCSWLLSGLLISVLGKGGGGGGRKAI